MRTFVIGIKYFIPLIWLGTSCARPFEEKNKIFHGAPSSNGISGLSFALYNDHRYQVMSSGCLFAFTKSGTYDLVGDTIILNGIDKHENFKSKRLLIFRYDQQDSTYWEWKYSRIYKSFKANRKLGRWLWEDHKSGDAAIGEGDVYQINENGEPIENAYHFIIMLDSLKNYR